MYTLKQQKDLTDPQTLFILSVIIIVITLSACSTPEKRVALVIGNNDYQNIDKLVIAKKDAKEVKSALEAAEFEVIMHETDLELKELLKVIKKFNAEAKDADAAVFYYSGHGMQHKGINYLIPVDADITKREDLDDQAVKLGDVLLVTQEKQRERVNIIILDACRNNGFEKENRGLAEVLPPKETLVAFATSPGKVAKDNGLYAKAFSETVKEFDGMRAQQIFDKVGQKIGEQTNSSQIPLYYTNISRDFYFVEKKHAKLIFTF